MASDVATMRMVVEQEAEFLVVYQLDLLAQLEHQLRAVHQTIRRIETLRSAKDRSGGELSNGQKIDTLDRLTEEFGAIDRDLQTQHESCQLMLATVEKMRERLGHLRRTSRAAIVTRQPDDPPPSSSRNRRGRSTRRSRG